MGAAGNELTGTAYGNPYLFTGRQWDAELGYYYYRNRYLDPVHGRFASRDPLGLWGDPLNLGNGYTYAASNPWSLVDPFGLAAGGNSNQEGPLGKMWRGFWKRIWDLGLFVLEADKLMKDPDHLAEQTLKATDEVKSTIGAVKEDPVGTARAVGDAAKEKLQNFGWEDAGYGAPDIAMSIKSLPNLLREAGNVIRAGTLKNVNRGNGGRGGGPDHARVHQDVHKVAGGDQEVAVKLGDTGKYRAADVEDARGRFHQIGDMRHRGGYRPSARERGAIEDIRRARPDATIIYHDKYGNS